MLTRKQFGAHREAGALVRDITTWVSDRLDDVPGSSTVTDGATDTLPSGAGVCRDYSHLTIGLLRALDGDLPLDDWGTAIALG